MHARVAYTVYRYVICMLTISRLSDWLLVLSQQSSNINLMQTSEVMSIGQVIDAYLASDSVSNK